MTITTTMVDMVMCFNGGRRGRTRSSVFTRWRELVWLGVGGFGIACGISVIFYVSTAKDVNNIVSVIGGGTVRLCRSIVRTVRGGKGAVSTLEIGLVTFHSCRTSNSGTVLTSRFFRLPARSDRFRRYIRDVRTFNNNSSPRSKLRTLNCTVGSS